MATQPKKDAIASAVVDALRGISKGAGYRTEIGKNVSRRRWNEVTVNATKFPVASVWIGNGEPSPVACMGSYKERAMVVVEVWVRAADQADLDTECLNAEADVKAALFGATAQSALSALGFGVVMVPGKNVADHQEFADLKIGSKAVGFVVDYNWTATAP